MSIVDLVRWPLLLVLLTMLLACGAESESSPDTPPPAAAQAGQEESNSPQAAQPSAAPDQASEAAEGIGCGRLCDPDFWQTATIDDVHAELTRGADLTATDDEGRTPLHLAVRYANHTDLVGVLLDYGAAIDARDDRDQTPLHLAGWRHEAGFAQLLLTRGASPNLLDYHGHTPLQIAASLARQEVVEAILDQGVDLDARGHDGWTALHHAVSNDDVESPVVALLLLDRGADSLALTEAGERACDLLSESLTDSELRIRLCGEAMAEQQTECRSLCDFDFWRDATASTLRLQLDAGADLTLRDAEGATPLHLAALLNWDPDVFVLLINAGADTEATTPDYGYTPLGYAVWGNNRVATRTLLELGANVSAKMDDGSTPLHIAAQRIEDIPPPLPLMSDDEQQDEETAQAAREMRERFPNTIRSLLDFGAHLHALDYYGHAPLHLAALSNRPIGIQLLLEYGADVNHRGHDSQTALHHAAEFGAADSITALIERGADVNALSDNGETPCDLAEDSLSGTQAHDALCSTTSG